MFLILILVMVCFLSQEKDIVARSNPDLHYNKAIVSVKKTVIYAAEIIQIYSSCYY